MPDPEGSNSGEQWVELLNRGRSEELKDMVLTNNEALSYILPSFDIAPGERVLIAMGRCDALPPHPNMTRTLEASLTETLYSSGDDLELKDRDGSTLDYIAWGVSKHIEGPKGSLGSLSWDGKVWDAISGSMSDKGFPNPSAITNKSLSRSPDGTDTDRTIDLTTHMGFLGSSPGWEERH
ncbi:MAG: lamin tail domain-containing protein [Desulfobacterales bacterium]|nr:lamin tail domain-containing protein [Desulfobacterales bacterium]